MWRETTVSGAGVRAPTMEAATAAGVPARGSAGPEEGRRLVGCLPGRGQGGMSGAVCGAWQVCRSSRNRSETAVPADEVASHPVCSPHPREWSFPRWPGTEEEPVLPALTAPAETVPWGRCLHNRAGSHPSTSTDPSGGGSVPTSQSRRREDCGPSFDRVSCRTTRWRCRSGARSRRARGSRKSVSAGARRGPPSRIAEHRPKVPCRSPRRSGAG